ncbi:GNAT family N-acetyltransferase [Domibacillus sp. 8LH]|uniref:GNAT family N-acetyltransferase n=1 Tax=Domibacillus sp. 8LH TaxID=3073900 RepID=UPI00317B8DE1
MKIIRAGLKDLPVLSPLFDAYRVFYGQPSDEKGAAAFLKERLEREESIVFIGYEKEKAAGFVQLYPTFTSVGMQRAYILNDLFVHPDCRKEGIGKALMHTAFQFCEDEGAKFVTLQTARDNITAQTLYEKVGMQRDTKFYSYVKSLT